jgi:hypothetical protein
MHIQKDQLQTYVAFPTYQSVNLIKWAHPETFDAPKIMSLFIYICGLMLQLFVPKWQQP